MLFGRKIQAGLDIGTYSVQWAAMDLKASKAEVWRAQIFADGQAEDKDSQNYRDRVASLLEGCAAQTNLWEKSVVVGVQGGRTVSDYLEFPKLTESELEMAVLSTVSREIPFPIDSMDVVHLPVKSLTPGRTAVFFSVWPKSETRRLTAICEGCDLKVKRIEATGIGLTRELFRNRVLDPDKFYGVVNMGHEVTQVIMVKGGYPYYLRDIPVGGRDMTKALTLRTRASWAEAEERKRQAPLFELFNSLGAVLGEISYELARTFKYFQRRFKVERVESIFLSGGASLLIDYREWLEGELEVPVIQEEWEGIKPRQQAEVPSLNKVALGLALGK